VAGAVGATGTGCRLGPAGNVNNEFGGGGHNTGICGLAIGGTY
jgi:hypothetical protein